jgi:hypothetical protein
VDLTLLDSPEPELIFVKPYPQDALKIAASKSLASATTYHDTARTNSHRPEIKEFSIVDQPCVDNHDEKESLASMFHCTRLITGVVQAWQSAAKRQRLEKSLVSYYRIENLIKLMINQSAHIITLNP